jgi:Cof subfamily protein (haloacid dehalogenase superfamily)
MIQLLALDLDDTLLGHNLEISPRNREALQAAEDRGVRIVLASGRAVMAMERYARELGMFERPGYMISDNGATISSTLPRAELLRHALERPLFLELLKAFDTLDLPVQVYRDSTILVTRDNPVTGVDMKLSGFSRRIVPDMAADLGFDPNKLVIPGDPEVLPVALQVIRKTFGDRVNAFISKPFFLEVLPVEADKGTALAYVARTLGIPAADVMAMGDAANDLGMIRFAGWGVAMANGTDEVRAAARIVSDATHAEDGVAEIIERWVLDGRGLPGTPKA